MGKSTDGVAVTNVNLKTDIIDKLAMKDFYSYDGSLTTPPCTEGIKWTVFKEPMNISEEQVNAYTQHFAGDETFAGGFGNNRQLMPLEDRTLYFSGTGSGAMAIGASALAF